MSDNVTLLWQDFELLPLGPAVDEDPAKCTGTDWTATPPAEWTVDNSNLPVGGKAEYSGWTFLDKTAWNAWSGQSRSNFTLASGTIAVADTDEWDDKDHEPGDFNGILVTPEIDLATVVSSAVTIEFDSSFRPEGGGGGAAEGNQTGVVEVSFDEGVTWTNLLTQDGSTSDGSATDPSVNRHEVLAATIPVGASSMQVRWGQVGSNDYWWAIDNVRISSTVQSTAFPGILDAQTFSFTTEAAAIDGTVINVGAGQSFVDTAVHSADAVIVKTGPGILVLNLANSHTGGLVIQEGEVVVQNTAALNGGPLVIAAGAKLTVDTGASRIHVASLQLDPAGLLDVGRGGLLVAAGGFDPTAVRQAIIAGRNGGTWTGAAGIHSDAAAAAPGRAVGYVIGNDGALAVAFAALGDVNLDNQFNAFDLVGINSSGVYGNSSAPARWQDGDFNFDGVVNVFDLVGANGSGVYGRGNYTTPPANGMVVSATSAVDSGNSAAAANSTPKVGSTAAVSSTAFAALAVEQDRVNASTSTTKKKLFAGL